jgi:hypothetical protein
MGDLAEQMSTVDRATGRLCARWPSDADDIRQEALLAVLAAPDAPAATVAHRAGVDYLRRVYGRPGGPRNAHAHVATVGQLAASEHLTRAPSRDPAELADPAVTWGLSGRLEMVARLLAAGWPKWRVAEVCGVSAARVSHHCAALREVA